MMGSAGDDAATSLDELNAAEETKEYLKKVLGELGRRTAALAKMDREIAELEAKLKGLGGNGAPIVGAALRTSSRESYRARLRERLKKLGVERQSLAEEVRRAEERKLVVEEELQAFES